MPEKDEDPERTKARLEARLVDLERRLVERARPLTLLNDITHHVHEASSWDEALGGILRLACAHLHVDAAYVYLLGKGESAALVPAIHWLQNPRLQGFDASARVQRPSPASPLVFQVLGRQRPLWLEDPGELLALLPGRAEAAREAGVTTVVAWPVAVGGEALGVIELISTRPLARDPEVQALVEGISTQIGQVLYRERLMAQAAELVWREQQGLVHTLHDALGQQLTGIGMLATALGGSLEATDPAAAATARRIADEAQQALDQVRQLSRGLFPVDVAADGLATALERLAAATQAMSGVRTSFEAAGEPVVLDNRIATELYRIAQEAVTNALKHSGAQAIQVRLTATSGALTLEVRDDGRGLSDEERGGNGMGLRIMRFRALSIGAALSIQRVGERGTLVSCTLRETPRGARSFLWR